jgi:hypothetical protein
LDAQPERFVTPFMIPAPFVNSALVDLARRDDSLVVFPHTQRTGGKALRDQVLCKVYGPERVYSGSRGTGDKTWQAVTGADLAAFKVFTGPSNFADLDKGRPTVFISLVRHPLYRAVSLYHYCRRRAGHKLHEIANRCTLEEFYPEASRIYPVYMRNTQCLRLAGRTSASNAQETILQKYLGVGFTSDVNGFGNALGAELGWPPFPQRPTQSDAERYDMEITPRFRDQVLAESSQDLKLYEWVAAGLPRKPFFSMLGFAGGRKQQARSS